MFLRLGTPALRDAGVPVSCALRGGAAEIGGFLNPGFFWLPGTQGNLRENLGRADTFVIWESDCVSGLPGPLCMSGNVGMSGGRCLKRTRSIGCF